MQRRSFMSKYDSESEDEANGLLNNSNSSKTPSNGAIPCSHDNETNDKDVYQVTVANNNMIPTQGQGYVEFFDDSVPCPTCRGIGRIHKDEEKMLVAIIPLTDKRLKPRRTCVYITLTVLLCCLIGAFLLFFLIPRSVTFSSDSPPLVPIKRTIVLKPNHKTVLSIVNCYNISNSNFFAISLTGSKVTTNLKRDFQIVGEGKNTTDYTVPPCATFVYCTRVNVLFEGNHAYVTDWCRSNYSYMHNLAMTFKLTANYTVLSQSLQTTLTTMQYVDCGVIRHFTTMPLISTTKKTSRLS